MTTSEAAESPRPEASGAYVGDAVLRCVSSDPDQYWDITVSTGTVYRTVRSAAFDGLLVITQRDNDFVTMVNPAHVVSVAISENTWDDPTPSGAPGLNLH